MIVKKRKTCCPLDSPFSKIERGGGSCYWADMFRFCPNQEENEGDCRWKYFKWGPKSEAHFFYWRKKQFSFAELAYHHYIAFDGKDDTAIELLASGIELLILSADIFDDIEDKDNLQASWMKIDPSIVINAATALYTLSLQVISLVSNNPQHLSLTLQYSLQSLQGQHVDLTLTVSSESEFIEMIKLKSGSLVTLPSVLGVYLATGEFNETVDEYSHYLGIVEQIANDHHGLYYPDNNDIKTRHNLAFYYLKINITNHRLTY